MASLLKQELENLYKQINRTEDRLHDMARKEWNGICCPSCGVPGYSDLVEKNDRRRERIEQIKLKLSQDTSDEFQGRL